MAVVDLVGFIGCLDVREMSGDEDVTCKQVVGMWSCVKRENVEACVLPKYT